MIDWLKQNKDSLSLRGIERQLNMPDTTLVKAVKGSQNLPKKWIEPLNVFLTILKKQKCAGFSFLNSLSESLNKEIKVKALAYNGPGYNQQPFILELQTLKYLQNDKKE